MTTPDPAVVLRPLAPTDLARVASLVRDSFEPGLLPYMVASQHGWADFVAVALAHPDQFGGQLLTVAEVDGEVVGFADFRRPGDGTGFLSYICVAPQARGRGIARSLLRDAVRASGPLSSVGLDVFADNTAARAMYDALGFAAESASQWWRRPLDRAGRPGAGPDAGLDARSAAGAGETLPLRLEGLPVALAALDRYGFCELTGTLDDRPVRCGRMGRSVLRLFDPADLDRVGDPGGLAAAMTREFPELAWAFAVVPEGSAPRSDDAELVNRVLRLRTTDIRRLLGEA